MLQIRPEQMAKFRDAATKRFEDDLILHLKRFFPHRCEEIGSAGLSEFVRHAIERAEAYAIRIEREVCIFADVAFIMGPDFETRPENAWAAEILIGERNVTSAQRVMRLRNEALKRLRADEATHARA